MPEYRLRILRLFGIEEVTKRLGHDHFQAVSEFSSAAKAENVMACELLIFEEGVKSTGLIATYSNPKFADEIRAAGWGYIISGVHSIVDLEKRPTKLSAKESAIIPASAREI